MLVSRTPFRVSIVGGGTDLKSYYSNVPGYVVSTSIDKFIYLSLHKYFIRDKSLLKYSETEVIRSNSEIKHNIIREVFKYYKITNVDFNSTADIPGGTGMGSSSAFTAGLINLCSYSKGIILSKQEIAELACEIEIEVLKNPIGKQDQYGCTIGGLNLIKFNPDETVEINPIKMKKKYLEELQDNLLLFYTNKTRKASDILTEQNKNTAESIHVKKNLYKMSQMAIHLCRELTNNNIESVGELLHESWCRKKELASNVSNKHIDELYEIALNNGAIGGKILGAGGGGFLLLYVPKHNQKKLRKTLNNIREFKFKFENEGSVIFNI